MSDPQLVRQVVWQVVGALIVVLTCARVVPFAGPSGSDDSAYLLLARDIRFEGGTLYRTQPEASLHFPPGYPWMLGFVVERDSLGYAPLLQRTFQGLVIAIGSVWATAVFGAGVGWLVFGLLALNPSLIYSSAMLSSEAPHMVLFLLGFIAWFQFARTGKAGSLVLSAGCLALSTYVRAYSLLLALFLPVFIIIRFWGQPRAVALRYVGMFCLCWVLILGPWTIRNFLSYGRFVPITTTGSSLYSAWFPPGPRQFGMMAHDEVSEQAMKIADVFERDAFYRQATVRKILADPAAALGTTLRKYLFYLMPFDWEFFGRYNVDGRLRPSLHYVYLFTLPFALIYIWRHRLNREFWVGPIAPLLFGLTMTGATYGIPRFRLCVEPFLIVFAAAFLWTWMTGNVRARVPLAGAYFLVCGGVAYAVTRLVL